MITPPNGYLKAVEALCKEHNVLFICDEIQCGLGRAGSDLFHLREGVRPDMVVLGKALSGGVFMYCLLCISLAETRRNVCTLWRPGR